MASKASENHENLTNLIDGIFVTIFRFYPKTPIFLMLQNLDFFETLILFSKNLPSLITMQNETFSTIVPLHFLKKDNEFDPKENQWSFTND